MRVVQFVQVVVLLLLLGYAVLVYLENPVLLRLPLLFAGRELVLPAGLGLGLGMLAGALYAALLLLPRYLRQRMLRRGDLLRRRDAETRLQATLQAVVDGSRLGEAAPAELPAGAEGLSAVNIESEVAANQPPTAPTPGLQA